MHGCLLSTVAADVLVLKHQAVSNHSADKIAVCKISTGPTPMASEFPVGPVDRQLPLARLACGNFVVIKFVDSIYWIQLLV